MKDLYEVWTCGTIDKQSELSYRILTRYHVVNMGTKKIQSSWKSYGEAKAVTIDLNSKIDGTIEEAMEE